MYSSKTNVNILTSQLVAYGVKHVVVCPGSRNAPLVHNFAEHPQLLCHPVTDERSAGFYAIGLCLSNPIYPKSPVAICVTSGSALMNLSPAIVEAYYRHLPIIVISADRPAQWIGQGDGQTMVQHGALQNFVAKTVTLPEPHDDDERWFCSRLVCEAMIRSQYPTLAPVHINVPISEPLFDFDEPELPKAQKILAPTCMEQLENNLLNLSYYVSNDRRVLVVVGQRSDANFAKMVEEQTNGHFVFLYDALVGSNGSRGIDLALSMMEDEESYQPDLIIYSGGDIVSKRLKQFLRRCNNAQVAYDGSGGEVSDLFKHLNTIVCTDSLKIILNAAKSFKETKIGNEQQQFAERWHSLLKNAENRIDEYQPAYSSMLAVKTFEEEINQQYSNDKQYYRETAFHYGNGMAVRMALIYARHYVYCNRGVNGIEGTVSTASGHSIATNDRIFCIVGDLGFFYDSNALWQSELKGNLRIMLLNNGGGGIFQTLQGMENSPVRDKLFAATHQATAEGICLQNDVVRLTANNEKELIEGIQTLVNADSQRPMLLEVFTDPKNDAEMYMKIYNKQQ